MDCVSCIVLYMLIQLQSCPHPKPQLCTRVPLNGDCIVHAYSAKIVYNQYSNVFIIVLRGLIWAKYNDRCLIKTIKTENITHKRNMA